MEFLIWLVRQEMISITLWNVVNRSWLSAYTEELLSVCISPWTGIESMTEKQKIVLSKRQFVRPFPLGHTVQLQTVRSQNEMHLIFLTVSCKSYKMYLIQKTFIFHKARQNKCFLSKLQYYLRKETHNIYTSALLLSVSPIYPNSINVHTVIWIFVLTDKYRTVSHGSEHAGKSETLYSRSKRL